MWMLMVALIFIAIAVIVWSLLPLWEGGSTQESVFPRGTPSPSTQDPLVIQQLLDLEYDYQTGKISYEEYVAQRDEILRSS